MTALESRMVLHRFMCDQFGYKDMRDMLNRLDRLPKGFMENNISRFSRVIAAYMHMDSNKVTTDDLARYDANIITHSKTLKIIDQEGRSWKPFQYLALLFTERYLDLYFQDQKILIYKLNEWKEEHYQSLKLNDYVIDDIHTLAFQSATGSGKTLLLHANILQYKHYLKEYKQLHKLNKIILVTPDEGLSHQHLRELQSSGIPAQLFSDHQKEELFSHSGAIVDIIDLHKLDEKKGIKRVALDAFEENNLVMVDEGHLGTGGKVWRTRRKQLAKNGFTFEYSATFNQAVSGSGDEYKKLRNEYGKSILFDYSYKFFYADGYGKDYKISNLQNTRSRETNNLYLLACLLMFYQQHRIYADKSRQWQDFNIASPLWVFLGKTVTSTGQKETETDVIRIIKFLSWVQKEREQAVAGIQRLTSGTAEFVDETGADIFRDSFSYIEKTNPKKIYDDLCLIIFHSKGQLHILHLPGVDELQLRVGGADPFGVINVGDASGLYTKLEAVENRYFSLSKDAFAKPLFSNIDNENSSINIVIGARKFAAGWNSWRVSTMGLMHVGTGEGPQIIQMFGRGVRLKGYGMSLKRHTALESVSPKDSNQLKLLETLNIFGLKANYMEKFKEYLEKEDISLDLTIFTLPTKKTFDNIEGLKILRKQDDVEDFQYSKKRLALPIQPKQQDCITLDRYANIQTLDSAGVKNGGNATPARQSCKIEKKHLSWINKRSVYHQILEYKRRFSWHNLTISQETINALLERDDWYTLYIPTEQLTQLQYGKVREWEKLMVDLICEYANQYWRRERSKWEHQYMEAVPLDDENLNYVKEYQLSIYTKEEELAQGIKNLVENFNQDEKKSTLRLSDVEISLLTPAFHAYVPLLHASSSSRKSVRITPVALNDVEAQFVKYLQIIVENKRPNYLKNKEIFLMRNFSRGKGVSFFDDYAFFPDFILWIRDSKKQNMLFIDPKGLVRFDSRVKSKVDLHKRIKKTEKIIQKTNPELYLHSYIWSGTPFKDIGSDITMTPDRYRQKGVFLAEGKVEEMEKLLRHALQ